jgi:hypothetical protein
VLIAGSLGVIPASSWATAAVDSVFPVDRVDEIDIETAAGAVSIDAEGDKFVKVSAPETGDECAMTQTLTAGVLLLSARGSARKSFTLDKTCEAGYAVVAPPGLRIKTRSITGDITIGAFTGSIEAKTGSGDIVLRGALGEITAHTGKGNISGAAPSGRITAVAQHGAVTLGALTGNASIRSGDGGVSLSWTSLPMRGIIDVRTSGGNQSIAVPGSARLALDMRSESGTTACDAPNDPRANLSMTLRSTSGAIVVKRIP